MKPGWATRFRLLDGVVVGAVALLALKVVDMSRGALDGPEPAPPPFAQVLAHARTNYQPPDPAATGSVEPKKGDVPKADGKEAGAGKPAAADALPPSARPAAESPSGSSSPAERALLERLGERREELQSRAREMQAREKLLDETERRLDARLGEIKAAEERRASAAAAAVEIPPGVKSLVTMYETMKPKEAARVFERLPHDVLLPVVRAMNARKMAEVLAAMSAESAEKLTVAVARAGTGPAPSAALPPGELPAIELPAGAPRPARAAGG